VKSEDNLQGNSSFNEFQRLAKYAISSLLPCPSCKTSNDSVQQVRRLYVYIIFLVELHVIKVYILQEIFFVAVAAYIQHCILKCASTCDFWTPLLRHSGDGPGQKI